MVDSGNEVTAYSPPEEPCRSAYDLGGGDILTCTRHLKGNPFRGEAERHAAEAYGAIWYWSDREAIKEPS